MEVAERLFAGASSPQLRTLLGRRRTAREFEDVPVSSDDLAGLVWAAQGASGEGRRVVPSAHKLYPLSVTAVVGNVAGLASGAYRYDSDQDRLQLVADGDHREAVAATTLADYDWLRHAAALLVLGGDMANAMTHFADQPPYGERGRRYVWLEAGCSAQNVYLYAAERELGAALVGGFDDDALSSLKPALLPESHEPLALIGIGHSPVNA